MTVQIQGYAQDGFAAVREAFAAAFADRPGGEQPGMGAALAIRHRGDPVVDLWAGSAHPDGGADWGADTASVIFSCTKGLTSLLAARLVQDGLLDYEAPVTDYWPEYGQARKGGTLVRQLLSHQAGLSAPRIPLTRRDIVDWDRMTGLLAAQEPIWTPGTGWAYHAITHGWLVGELVRRVTGLSVGAYFREAVTAQLGASAWIGLPPSEQHRVATMVAGPTLLQDAAEQAARNTSGLPNWPHLAMTLGGALPAELVGAGTGFNDPVVRAAEIPGAGGIATARALATIWSAAVTETDGVRLLTDETLREALRVQSEGQPVISTPPPWPRWAMGFQLDSVARRYLGEHSFGHDGAGGQVTFADSRHGVGFAFLTNRMEAIDDHRATRIIAALRECLAAGA